MQGRQAIEKTTADFWDVTSLQAWPLIKNTKQTANGLLFALNHYWTAARLIHMVTPACVDADVQMYSVKKPCHLRASLELHDRGDGQVETRSAAHDDIY